MGSKVSPTVIGAFVIGALALAVVGLLLFGGPRFFAEKRTYVLYFDGSAQGLNKGAPVVFRGVPVGTVSDIVALYDPQQRNVRIQVLVEIAPDSIKVTKGAPPTAPDQLIQELIQNGLRAQLQLQSFVTGLLYVDLDVHPGAPLKIRDERGKYPELPTVPSPLERLKATLEQVMTRLGKLPLEEIVGDLSQILRRVKHLVGMPETERALVALSDVLTRAKDLVQHADSGVTALTGQAQGLIKGADTTLGGLQEMLQTIDRQVAHLLSSLTDTSRATQAALRQVQQTLAKLEAGFGEEAGATLVQARQTLTAYESVVADNSPMLRDLERTLRELSEAARSIRVFADYLQRNPSALIYGKSRSGGR
jgi:paraquat-inducible protein B